MSLGQASGRSRGCSGRGVLKRRNSKKVVEVPFQDRLRFLEGFEERKFPDQVGRIHHPFYSRIRSEGFLFIVGALAVGPVFASCLWSALCVVVMSSWSALGQLVSSLPLGGAHKMRKNHHLHRVQSGGSLTRNTLSGAPTSSAGSLRMPFAWQAPYFGSVLRLAVSFLRGRRDALCLCVLQFRGRRSIL